MMHVYGNEVYCCSLSCSAKLPSFLSTDVESARDVVVGEGEKTDDLFPPVMMSIKLLGCLLDIDGEEDSDTDELVNAFCMSFLVV